MSKFAIDTTEALENLCLGGAFLTAGDLNTDNNTVTIKAEAKVTDKTIKSITLPDGTVVESSNTEFTVDVNGTYTFKAVDNEGNEVSNEIRISNICRLDILAQQ